MTEINGDRRLDPLISEQTAVPLIEASQMFQIEALQTECRHYLEHCINSENVLFLLNSAYCLNTLNADLYRTCRRIIFECSAYSILSNQGFYGLHPDIIIDIISCDDFQAKETTIWSSSLKWAQNVRSKKLKFPRKNKRILNGFRSNQISDGDSDDVDDGKESEDEMDEDTEIISMNDKKAESEDQALSRILRPIIPFIRFPFIDREYFIENICKYLNRKQAESVLIHHILNRETIFNHTPRRSFASFRVIAASQEEEGAAKLPDLNQDALFCSQGIRDEDDVQWFVVDVLFIGIIERLEIKNRYSDKDTLRKFKLQRSEWRDKYRQQDGHWIDVQEFKSQQSDEWQVFNVDVGPLTEKSRYWRIVLLDTYGGYTCLNHLKVTVKP